ncbi:MAG: MATE family efflux transporter [Oscillospiraceae bacterium]
MRSANYIVLPPDKEQKIFGLFTRDRTFYRTFFPLLAVITLQQLAALAVNMADNIMLGTYTELALSGATLVNQIQFTLQQIAAGIGMGIVVLASQYWGQRRTEPIKKIINIGVKFGFMVGIIFFVVSKAIPTGVLSLFTNDQAVIAEGARYLNVICWTYLVFSVSNSLMYSLQSVETAMIGTVMSISTICINICLNYCFIYGNFGAPELGIVGAAVATLVSRIVELFIILIYVLFVDKKLRMKLHELLRFDFTYVSDYIKVSTPIVLSGMLWGVAQAAQTAVLGHISATVIAANSIAIVIFQIFAVVGMSCANVASVTTGKTIGEGRLDMVRSYAKTMQAIFLLIGIVFGGLMFILKDSIVGIYSVSDETKELAISFLTVLSITTVGTCYEYPVESGIIAGGGVTKYAAVVDNLFMWLFTIPAAFLSAFVFKFPPLVTFCFLKADQILKCIPNSITCNRYRWVRVLTREGQDKPEQPIEGQGEY